MYLSLPVQSIRTASLLPKWRPSQLCVFRYYFPSEVANKHPKQRLLRSPLVPASVLVSSVYMSSTSLAADDGAVPSSSVRPGRSASGEKVRLAHTTCSVFIAKSLVYVASDLPYARTQSHHRTRGDPQPACALHHAEQRISVQCARRREELCADRCRQMDHF